MNREEAITTLKNYIERITGGMFPGEREILVEAFDALHSPWVKTAERLPTKADAGFHGQVMTCYHDEWDCFQFLEKWDEVPVRENLYWHGLPMPPEVEK